jgi:hypothetical protein
MPLIQGQSVLGVLLEIDKVQVSILNADASLTVVVTVINSKVMPVCGVLLTDLIVGIAKGIVTWGGTTLDPPLIDWGEK